MKKSISNFEETITDFGFSSISNDIEEMNSRIRDANVSSQSITFTAPRGSAGLNIKALLGTSALIESLKEITGLDTNVLKQVTFAVSRESAGLDIKALLGTSALTESLKGIAGLGTNVLSQSITFTAPRGSAGLDIKALLGTSALTESLKEIAGLDSNVLRKVTFAVSMGSINLEDATGFVNLDETDDYYMSQVEILVEWYTTLIAHLQQVWNVITTDKAMKIMTVASFIMSIVGTILAVNGAFPEGKEQTPEINIHNYSDDVEIETKTEENQVEIFIQDKGVQQDSTDDKWLSGGDRT